VADGTSGIVVWNPHRPDQAAGALATLLDDEGRRAALGAAARRRAVDEFAYDALAPRLDAALGAWR
jgi:glycosyltransferase involved in cell wall biosynthesis